MKKNMYNISLHTNKSNTPSFIDTHLMAAEYFIKWITHAEKTSDEHKISLKCKKCQQAYIYACYLTIYIDYISKNGNFSKNEHILNLANTLAYFS